jgi:hypothetical protein
MAKESKFSKFRAHLEREGYSRNSATRIAASEGAKRYGWEGMAERAAASRRRHEAARA